MLPAFDLGALAAPTSLVFTFALWASWCVTRSPLAALLLASAKAGLYLAYYTIVFDGQYTILDDWTYVERGAELLDAGAGWFNLIESLPLLLAAGEGNHFLYYLFNATAIQWFGDGYYAPVALNVMASVGVAWLSTRLVVAERLCKRSRAPLFFAFVLLHPDITAWSTVMNGKDTLVLLLHVLLLIAVSWYLRGERGRALVLAGVATGMLLFLRFYVPLLFAVALCITAVLQRHGRARIRLLGVAVLLLAALAWQQGPEGLGFVRDALLEDLLNPVVGVVHFLLTPIPFNTEAAYAFLDLPALLHWLLLPAAVLGVWRVQHLGTPFARYLLTYTFVFMALYAVYGELQGPRHRMQLDFAWATYQFLGIGVFWSFARALAQRPSAIATQVGEAAR